MAAKPGLKKIMESLQNEVLMGRAYYGLVKGLTSADPVVRATAPTFFGLTVEASLQVSLMYAAKLYDETRGAVTVETLLTKSLSDVGTFKNGTPDEIADAVARSREWIAGLQSILTPIKKRRHEALAHLDPRTVNDPQALLRNSPVTLPELMSVFDATAQILNDINVLYCDTSTHFDFIGGDDYEMALTLISDAKCAQADKYEEEFGEPAPFKRPAHCRDV